MSNIIIDAIKTQLDDFINLTKIASSLKNFVKHFDYTSFRHNCRELLDEIDKNNLFYEMMDVIVSYNKILTHESYTPLINIIFEELVRIKNNDLIEYMFGVCGCDRKIIIDSFNCDKDTDLIWMDENDLLPSPSNLDDYLNFLLLVIETQTNDIILKFLTKWDISRLNIDHPDIVYSIFSDLMLFDRIEIVSYILSNYKITIDLRLITQALCHNKVTVIDMFLDYGIDIEKVMGEKIHMDGIAHEIEYLESFGFDKFKLLVACINQFGFSKWN